MLDCRLGDAEAAVVGVGQVAAADGWLAGASAARERMSAALLPRPAKEGPTLEESMAAGVVGGARHAAGQCFTSTQPPKRWVNLAPLHQGPHPTKSMVPFCSVAGL